MTQTILEAALGNAVSATVLAGIVWPITRFCRSPAVSHLLWLIVLLKLVSPPLVSLPWGMPLDINGSIATDAGSAANARESMRDDLAAHEVPFDESHWSLGLAAESAVEKPQPSPARVPDAADRVAQRQSEPLSPSISSEDGHGMPASAWWLPLAIAIWSGGGILLVGLAASRIARFHRRLDAAGTAPAGLEAMAARLAARMGVRRYPDIRVIDAQIPPLLWPLGRRPTIVLSRTLLDGLSSGELRTLVAHELAHLRRRDHLVRWLELIVLAVYWWHPVAWWIRGMLRRSEEEACDSFVVWMLRGDGLAYATALVRTIDLLTEPRRMAPAISSGLLAGNLVQHRIKGILNLRGQPFLRLRTKLLIVSAACLLLPLSFGAASDESADLAERATASPRGNADPAAARPQQVDLYGDPLPAGAIARLGTVRFRHSTNVQAVAISPDASIFASAAHGADLRVWDARTGKLLYALDPDWAISVDALTFSPDGTSIAAGGRIAVVPGRSTSAWWIWDAKTGGLTRVRFGDAEGDRITDILFSPDSSTLATSHSSGAVWFWDVASGDGLLIVPPRAEIGREGRTRHTLALSSDAGLLASAFTSSRESTIEIWTLEQAGDGLRIRPGENVLQLDTKPREEVVSLAFTTGGTELIVGYTYWERRATGASKRYSVSRSKVLVWDPTTGKQVRELQRRENDRDTGASLAMSQDGKILATATEQEVVIWDVATSRPIRVLTGFLNRYGPRAHDLALSRDGSRLAMTTAGDTAIRLWDTATGELLPEQFESHSSRLASANFFAGGSFVVTRDRTGLHTWEAMTGRPVHTASAPNNVNCRAAVSDELLLLPVKPDIDAAVPMDQLQYWNLRSAKLVNEKTVPGNVTSTAISSDGRLTAAAYGNIGYAQWPSGKRGISVLEAASGDLLAELATPQGIAIALAFAPDRPVLYYVTADSSLIAWNFQTGEHMILLTKMQGIRTGLSAGLAFSPDSRTLAASASWSVHIYDIAEKRERLSIKIPFTDGNKLAISPDNRVLATAGIQVSSATQEFDEAIYLWDLQTGEQIKKVGLPDAAVTAMAFSSDGKRLVTATTMGTALVWDLR